MAQLAKFELADWVEGKSEHASLVLAGSATPGLTLDELISISSDPDATKRALSFNNVSLNLGTVTGSLAIREHIASFYQGGKHAVTPDHVITATGTTGANLNVLYSLLRPGDHVVCEYPIYNQLLDLSLAQGCEVSLWKLNPHEGWSLDVQELRSLIKPNTKLLILNNPNNPTGSYLDEKTQVEILDIARERNLIVMADEIFRPLFHGRAAPDQIPPSFIQHDYSRVIVTGSVSKAWGLTGARLGWIVSRDRSLIELFLNTRSYISEASSTIDELIVTEALSERCRPAILERHLGYARANLAVLDEFVAKNKDLVRWTKPTAAATAFIQFLDKNGEPLDDVEFCQSLLETQGVLLSPGSLCFATKEDRSFKGFVRLHFTGPPTKFSEGLKLIDVYLQRYR